MPFVMIRGKLRFVEKQPLRILRQGRTWVQVNSRTDPTKWYKVGLRNGKPTSCTCLGWLIVRLDKNKVRQPCEHMRFVRKGW